MEQTQIGGRINATAPRKVRWEKHEPERKERERKKKPTKLRTSKAIRSGGTLKPVRAYHDPNHKMLIHHLSGRGARHDPPRIRRMMSDILQSHHPDLHKAYISGKTPQERHHHQFHQYQANPDKKDVESDVTNYGGSLLPISHYENGVPVVHNPDWHSHFEIV